MTAAPITHHTFTIDRLYPVTPAAVFRANAEYDAYFHDIEPDECIVVSYEMSIEGTRISVSLATTELEAVDGGTRLVFTEQGAYIGDEDQTASREEGSRSLLDALAAELSR